MASQNYYQNLKAMEDRQQSQDLARQELEKSFGRSIADIAKAYQHYGGSQVVEFDKAILKSNDKLKKDCFLFGATALAGAAFSFLTDFSAMSVCMSGVGAGLTYARVLNSSSQKRAVVAAVQKEIDRAVGAQNLISQIFKDLSNPALTHPKQEVMASQADINYAEFLFQLEAKPPVKGGMPHPEVP